MSTLRTDNIEDLEGNLFPVSKLSYQSSDGETRVVENKLSEVVSVKDFGAKEGVNSSSSFEQAGAYSVSNSIGILVPEGNYPVDEFPEGKFYGPGIVTRISDSVSSKLDLSSPQLISFDGPSTFPQRYTFFQGQEAGMSYSKEAYASVGVGPEALKSLTIGSRNTSVGAGSLSKIEDQYSNSAFGADAGRDSDYADRCSLFGANSGKWNGTSDPVGSLHDFFLQDQTNFDSYGLEQRNPDIRNSILGSVESPLVSATSGSDNQSNSAFGRNALLHGVRLANCTALGYNAGAHVFDCSNSTFVGVSAGRDAVSADRMVAIGVDAGLQTQTGNENIAIGVQALRNNVHSSGNVAIGDQALSQGTGESDDETTARGNFRLNVAVGYRAASEMTTGTSNTCVGASSLKVNKGVANSALGTSSLGLNETGSYSTALGYNAGLLTQAGNPAVAGSNSTCVGANASISGDNQVQLGDSDTTTYVYGTVQNRSDYRDKADIEDTKLGLDFIKGLRPVSGVWDMREDYIEVVEEDGSLRTIKHEKDGSRKRTRKHEWFIAQEVESLCNKLGVEFGGLQNHAVNGGEDVYSLGYDEFIPPIVKALQDISSKVDSIESRLKKLEE